MNKLWLPIVFTALLVACGGDDESPAPAVSTGTIFLTLTDAPVDDAAEVVIVFTGVELQRSQGESVTINFDRPRSIDLLQFRDGATTALLAGTSVSAGQYSGLRLLLTAQQNLQSGSYTVAATRFFEIDADPTGNEYNPAVTGVDATMVFNAKNVTLIANATTRVDFP